MLYELVSEKKAFSGDWAVQIYRTSEFPLPIVTRPQMPRDLHSHLSGIIHELLERDPARRPRSTDASALFAAYSLFFDPSHGQNVDAVEWLPLYPEWRCMVFKYRNEEELMWKIGEYYQSTGNDTIAAAVFFPRAIELYTKVTHSEFIM